MSLEASGEVARPVAVGAAGFSASLYEETQWFHPALYVLLLFSGIAEVLGVGAILARSDETTANMNLLILGSMVGLMCFLFNLLVLRIRVDGREIYAAIGWLPLFWTRIALSEVGEIRMVEYRPLRDAGGWGMRFGNFEGEKCRFWNARGNRGVLLLTPNRRVILGSQQPEELYRALKKSRIDPSADLTGR